MASVKDKNLGLNLGWQFGETPWNTGMDTNMVVLGSMANLTVKSATTKAEPFGNDGDVYFIPVGATGSNWSGKANHIAIYSGESTYSTTNVASVIGWVFIPIRQGWTFTVQDQGNRLVTWDALLGLTDTVNVSTFLTAASSYTATGNVTFSGSVKFSGTHSADTTELATLEYVNSAISSQDFSNYAKLDASQTFTGNVIFSEEVQGKLATQPTSLATLKNVTDAISGITLENTGEGFGIAEINTNGNLTFKKLRSTNSTVSIVDTPEGLNLTVAMPVSVQEFTDLLDAPSSYVGAANQYVKVNTDASGLEFSEGFDEKFISLSDVPSSYIGSEGKYLVVDGGKVAFKALPSFSTAFKFTELTDTPNLIATSAVGRHNLLRGSRTSPAKLEFTGDLLLPQKSTELPQMPSVLEAGKYLRVKGDNSGYELVSGTGGGGSDSSTTIKGDWTPPVTSIPALAKMQRAGATFFPMADVLIDEVVFTDNSVSTSENGEGGMAISSTPFDITGSTENRFVVYMRYEGTETPDYIYYGTYAGLATLLNVGGMDMPFVFSPTVYYAPDLGLVEGTESDPVTLYADWNPHADSVAFVMDFDREVVEVWASRNNGTKVLEQTFVEIEQSIYDDFEAVVTIDKHSVTRAALNTYFPVEEGEDTRLVNSGKMSAAKTFDVSPSAVDVFDSTQVIDLTPPTYAANNAFILDVSDPVHIPELGKELENGDIVFFDENKTPIRYIPKEFADDAPIKVWQPTLQPSQYLFENAVDIGYGSAPVISNGGKTATGIGAAFSTTLEEFLSYDYEAGVAFTLDLASATDSPAPFGVWLGDSADLNLIDFMIGAQVVREDGSLFVFVSYGSPQEIPPTATQLLLTVQRVSADMFIRIYTDVDPSTPLIQMALDMPPNGLEAFALYNLLPSTVTLLSKSETSFDYVDITDAGLGIDETDLPTQPNGNLYELSLVQDVRLSSLGRVVKDKDIVAFGQDGQPIQIIQEVNVPAAPDLSGFATEEWVEDKGYVSNAQIDTDETLSSDSDALIPSQKAVKAYVDGQVTLKPWTPELSYVPYYIETGASDDNFAVLLDVTGITFPDDGYWFAMTDSAGIAGGIHLIHEDGDLVIKQYADGGSTVGTISGYGDVGGEILIRFKPWVTGVRPVTIYDSTGEIFSGTVYIWKSADKSYIAANTSGEPAVGGKGAVTFKILSGVYTSLYEAKNALEEDVIASYTASVNNIPANATSNIFEITGTATPLQWDELGGTVVDGDLVAFDSAGVPFVVDVTARDYGTMAFVDDADSDGKAYARKDGSWVEVDKPQTIEVVTANKTLTAADNNKILLISTDGLTITLPSAIPNFTVDIVKMDEDFITVVVTNGTNKFREDTTTITVAKDVTIFSTEVVGKEYVAIGAYEV